MRRQGEDGKPWGTHSFDTGAAWQNLAANDNDVLILERAGARYVWQITIDEEAETVTVWGQSNRTITFTWDELRI